MKKEEVTNTEIIVTNIVSMVYQNTFSYEFTSKHTKRENVLPNYHYLILENESVLRKNVVAAITNC